MNRREFLRTATRWLVGGVLGGGVGYLALGRGACDLGGACGACPQLAGCDRPEATACRAAPEKEEPWTDRRR